MGLFDAIDDLFNRLDNIDPSFIEDDEPIDDLTGFYTIHINRNNRVEDPMGRYEGAYTITDERNVTFLRTKINSNVTYLHNLDQGPAFLNPGKNALGKVVCVSSFPREGYDIYWGTDVISSVRSTSLLGIKIKYVCDPQGWEITGRRLPTNSYSVRQNNVLIVKVIERPGSVFDIYIRSNDYETYAIMLGIMCIMASEDKGGPT